MKIDAKRVKQFVGVVVGGTIFGLSAMDMGREGGLTDGAALQAEWVSKAIAETYSEEVACSIRNNINAKIGEYMSRR